MTPEEIVKALRQQICYMRAAKDCLQYTDGAPYDDMEYHIDACIAAVGQIESLTHQLSEKDNQFAALTERAEKVEAELKEAVEFIHYLDYNYSNYLSISDNERFTKWRGARKGGKDG